LEAWMVDVFLLAKSSMRTLDQPRRV